MLREREKKKFREVTIQQGTIQELKSRVLFIGSNMEENDKKRDSHWKMYDLGLIDSNWELK